MEKLLKNYHFLIPVGAEQKLIDLLSPDAQERITVAISSFSDITEQFIRGDIQMKLLSYILNRASTFTELLKTGECEVKVTDCGVFLLSF